MTGHGLAIWHLRDWMRDEDGKQWAMCGIELPRQAVGVVQTCEGCLAESKSRREAKRAT